jgi:4-hydroxybenzoate polyprenyltransferase
VDLRIWPHARRALLVSPAPGVQSAFTDARKIDKVFEGGGGRVVDYVRAMRLHQWVKNILVFAVLIASHQASNLQLFLQCLTAFVAFGLVASSAYVLNDLLDLTADRRHPRKRARPIPAARISIIAALWMVALLLAGGVAIALLLPPLFLVCLAVYYTGTLAYSFKLKNFAILDVCTLAALYTLRIIAGAAAIDTQLSFWLLAFSMFMFLSLALVKRYSELTVVAHQGRGSATGRGYQVSDLTVLQALGVSSAMAAVLVLALYVNNPEITKLYSRPEAIWLLCPLFLYWIARIWMITHRGDMHDDPIVFTFGDATSLLIGILCGIVLLAAI